MSLPRILRDPRLSHFAERARVDCGKLFEYACPLYWGGLQPTDDPAVRHCDQCNENVYFTDTADEFIERASRGQCVAVLSDAEAPRVEDLPDESQQFLTLGRLIRPPSSRGHLETSDREQPLGESSTTTD